jgi:hypothetical protein
MAEDSKAMPVGYNGFAEITMGQVYTRNLAPGELPEYDDAAAASLVVQDYNRARVFVDSEMFSEQWVENDILYDVPLLDSLADPTRARVPRYTVNNQSNTMGDAVKNALFAQKPPFLIRPRGKTSELSVKGWTALLDTLLDRMDFQYWTGLGISSQALHGTGVWKGGWSKRPRVVRKRKAKASKEDVTLPLGGTKVTTEESLDYETVDETIEESYPWLENRLLGTTLFDPGWRTPNRPDLCGFVVDIDYPTWMDLEGMRNEGCYKIPDAEALKAFFFHNKEASAEGGTDTERSLSLGGSVVSHAEERSRPTTADPLGQPMMMLERHDKSRVMTCLCFNSRTVTIRNDKHRLGRIPHFTANWRSKLNTGWGMGMGKLVGGDQRIEQGTLDHALNLLAYQANPAILHIMGQNAPTGNRTIRAGGFFAVTGDDVRKAMGVMEMPKIPPEAWQMIQYSKTSSEETSGADATFMQGQLQGKGSSAARTATGAGRIAAKADSRVQTPVENIELGLLVPFLYMLVDMCKIYMPTKEVLQILNGKLAAEIMKDFDADEFMSAEIQIEMLAAAKLAAKVAMAQQLPYLMEIFQQPQLLQQLHNEGKTISLDTILDVLFQVSEFRIEDQIIVPMTDQEKQMVLTMNAPNAKVQEATTVEKIKGDNALNLADRKSQNDLATTVAEKALERDEAGIPLDRAEGLLQRSNDEKTLAGQGPSTIAGA